MKKIAGIVILLSLVAMALFPVAVLADDPPDMDVEIWVIGDEVHVSVNGDMLANKADLAGLKNTGSPADLWMWNTVHALEDYALYNETNIKLLMDSQAKTIYINQVLEGELGYLDSRVQNAGTDLWETKSRINDNTASIQYQQEALEYTDALLLSTMNNDRETVQWLEVNNAYWSNRVQTLETKIRELEGEEEEGYNGLMVYGGYGLAVCFLAAFVIRTRNHR